ncbi:MAG: hypothetical protein BGO41_10525 [Clostridiales bacterium 38-18]|nr:MAG: hypothetical protein BGO41_10525 [Clostridiales bacterium 38-18]
MSNISNRHNTKWIFLTFGFVAILALSTVAYIGYENAVERAEQVTTNFFVRLYEANPSTLSGLLPEDTLLANEKSFETYITKLNQSVDKKLKGRFTEKFKKELMGNRLWMMAPDIAKAKSLLISVTDVTLERVNIESDEIYFNFQVTVESKLSETDELFRVDVEKGQIRLVRQGIGYRIDHINYTASPFIKNSI